ncbi:MAG: aminocarboxymuconate-semialdehyde decarboxylase [Solirubrobacteraceae bacterium]|jgi:aminocarboxymuconate-semialdehyde decarboxylase|nr:aminocarboxymuconate-semialdehyde decarboxylase [Solirubrobacteraceae bacterium]
MQVVDVHTHFIPMEFVDLLRGGEGPPGVEVTDRDGQDPLVVHDNGLAYPVMPLFHDLGARLEQMDGDGIGVSLISIVPSLFLYWTDPVQTERVCRIINDAGAALAGGSGGRLHALATVPMNAPAAAAAELRRAHGEHGMRGVEIGTSVGDMPLDDPSLEPFFAVAEELEMPVMLHPYMSMVSPPGPAVQGFHLANVIGNPLETFVAASRLIVGGVLDRHPGLRVLLVHAGGAFPYQLGRLQHAYEARAETRELARLQPAAYIDRFLFDTVIFDRRALRFLIERVGAERVLFGTDIPFDMADLSARDLAEDVDGPTAEAVLAGNAARAFGLTGVSAA